MNHESKCTVHVISADGKEIEFEAKATITNLEANWWNDPAIIEPPKDGTAIIAKGRIIAEDEFGCTVSPYLGEIRWLKTESGFEGWMYGGSQPLSVTCSPDETFVIDWWIEPPRGESVSASCDDMMPDGAGGSKVSDTFHITEEAMIKTGRCMAASFDMLAVLEQAINLTLDDDDVCHQAFLKNARAAIAMARGK